MVLFNYLIYTTIALILLALTEQTVVRLHQHSQQIYNRLRLEQELMLAGEHLAAVIEHASLNSCGSLQSLLSIDNVNSNSPLLNLTTAVEVYPSDKAEQLGLNKQGKGALYSRSPILVIRNAVYSQTLNNRVRMGDKQLRLPGLGAWQVNDMVLINDCIHLVANTVSEILQTTNGSAMILQQAAPYDLASGSTVQRYDVEIYYLGEDGQAHPALYRLNRHHQREVLYANIDQFEIQLGLYNAAHDSIGYVEPEQIQDWQSVRSLKITLGANDTLTKHLLQTLVVPLKYHHEF